MNPTENPEGKENPGENETERHYEVLPPPNTYPNSPHTYPSYRRGRANPNSYPNNYPNNYPSSERNYHYAENHPGNPDYQQPYQYANDEGYRRGRGYPNQSNSYPDQQHYPPYQQQPPVHHTYINIPHNPSYMDYLYPRYPQPNNSSTGRYDGSYARGVPGTGVHHYPNYPNPSQGYGSYHYPHQDYQQPYQQSPQQSNAQPYADQYVHHVVDPQLLQALYQSNQQPNQPTTQQQAPTNKNNSQDFDKNNSQETPRMDTINALYSGEKSVDPALTTLAAGLAANRSNGADTAALIAAMVPAISATQNSGANNLLPALMAAGSSNGGGLFGKGSSGIESLILLSLLSGRRGLGGLFGGEEATVAPTLNNGLEGRLALNDAVHAIDTNIDSLGRQLATNTADILAQDANIRKEVGDVGCMVSRDVAAGTSSVLQSICAQTNDINGHIVGVARDILDTKSKMGELFLQSTIAQNQQFSAVDSRLCGISHEMQRNAAAISLEVERRTNDLAKDVAKESAETRELIQATNTQNLRDRIVQLEIEANRVRDHNDRRESEIRITQNVNQTTTQAQSQNQWQAQINELTRIVSGLASEIQRNTNGLVAIGSTLTGTAQTATNTRVS